MNYVIVGVIGEGISREDEPIAAFRDKWLADKAMKDYSDLSGIADRYDNIELWTYEEYFSEQ